MYCLELKVCVTVKTKLQEEHCFSRVIIGLFLFVNTKV